MKILQLVTKRQYRGAEVFAANLSSELIVLGHKIVFAGLYKNEDEVLFVENAENIDISASKAGIFSADLTRKLITLINRIKPDVVQCNGSDTLKYMVAASYFIQTTPILYRNISMISEWVNTSSKIFLYKNMFKRVAHVSSVGKEAAADLVRTLDYPKSKVSVIRRGIPTKEINDEKLISEYRKNFGLKVDDKIAVHIGNFSPEKNHDFLLNLFSEIKLQDPNIKLLSAGTGVLYDEIKRKTKERALEDTIFLLGFRKDIPELLAMSDCFVLSSKVEGVPGVILEAAIQKKPSVATNVGGVSEVLLDEETGFLINDFNLKDFKEKLLRLLHKDDMRKRMGEKAHKLVSEEYNPKLNARKFEDLYKKLVAEK